MTTRIGINGFGRIGRQVLKIMKASFGDQFDVVAFNDLGDLKTMAHLYARDSVYGRYEGQVKQKETGLVIDGDHIRALSERDPAALPWGELGVEIVIESTGIFRTREAAAKHLEAGAKKVVISAPAKDPDLTIVVGVNSDEYDPGTHHVVSNASCTTNCLAPAAKVLHEHFGIEKGLLTTVHAYTSTQALVDMPHKDLRRARAAALNIIPTSTGAAKAVALVMPELEGKFDGISMRVPVPTGSVVDFVALLERDTTTEEVHDAYREAADGYLNGILAFSTEPLVSTDIIGDPHSSIVDAGYTFVMAGNMVKVISWYDNEWGYSSRTVDLAELIGRQL